VSALVLVAGAALTLRFRPAVAYVPGRVVVAPFENQTGDSALSDFTRQFTTTLPNAIVREGVGEPVPAATVRDVLTEARGSREELVERLARRTGAGLELRGACSRVSTQTACQVDVLRMPAKVLRMSVSANGDPAQPSFSAELTERVLVALSLQRMYGDRVSWLGEYLPRSLAAVRAFEQAEDMDQNGDTASGKYWTEAARLDTAWVFAAVQAAWGDTARVKRLAERLASRPGLLAGDREWIAFTLAAHGSDAERAFEYARRRFMVNPESWLLPQLTLWALTTNRPNTAVAVSSYADSAVHLHGGWLLATYMFRGYALHQLRRYEEELRLARDLARRFPGGSQLPARTHESMALAALGEVDSLRRRLAEWEATPEPAASDWAGNRAVIAGQELMAHGHEPEGRDVLTAAVQIYRRLRGTHVHAAQAEVNSLEWTGQLEEARRLALTALPRMRSWADSLNFLGPLGCIAARQSHRADALRYDRLLAASRQGAPLERATIAACLGDRQGAVRLLEDARSRGVFEVAFYAGSWSVHRLPDFAPLRGYPPFEQFLRPRDGP
jgi:hypothetical protein